MKLFSQLPLPLFRQLRRTQNRHAADLPPVEQLAGDHASLDGFSDAHVIRNEETNGIQLERHHQRHKLVWPGFHGNPPKAAEWTGSGAGRKACSITQ